MLDFRYHALSLAAVLCALAVGVLVGVAIGDSSLVSSAQDGLVHNLRGELRESQHELEAANGKLAEQQSLAGAFEPLAVHGMLEGRRVGVLFLGDSSDEVDSLVRQGVQGAGGEVRSVAAVREPLNTSAIAAQASGTRYAALASDPRLMRRFGTHVGGELVSQAAQAAQSTQPSQPPSLLERVRTTLLSSDDGQLGGLEGVVVMRAEPSGMTGSAVTTTREFESGLLAGIAARGVPVVGVETTATEPSQVPWYKTEGISSVDDLDSVGGRAALAYALAGYRGAFGVKSSADAQLPSPQNAPSSALAVRTPGRP
jgi:hypothetical protein